MTVSGQLTRKQTKLKTMEEERKKLSLFKSREKRYNNKLDLQKRLNKVRPQLGKVIREIFSVLPSEVTLSSMEFREKKILVEGKIPNPRIIEEFVRTTTDLDSLGDPKASRITRNENGAIFAIHFDLHQKKKK